MRQDADDQADRGGDDAAGDDRSRTGHPCSSASCAVVSAPTPAKVIWQSQSMPPSPVTSVYARKIDGEHTPVPIRPSQYGWKISGSSAIECEDHDREPEIEPRVEVLGVGRRGEPGAAVAD